MEKSTVTKKRDILKTLKQIMPSFGQLAFIIFIAVSNVVLFSAFEAYVINVTARICTYVETRTMGFWKNHLYIILESELLPQCLGYDCSGTGEEGIPWVQNIFKNADADVMVDMLKGQLLAMKFNAAYFDGTGNFNYDGQTINEIIQIADDMLKMDPLPPREELEYAKNLLDYLNNQHQLTHCSEPNSGLTLFGTDESYISQLLTSVNSIEIIIEPPSCTAGEQQQCDTGLLGVCSVGIQGCDQAGEWTSCLQTNTSSTEICDNRLDDNCDGLTDCNDLSCTEEEVCQTEQTKEQSSEELLPPKPFCGDNNLDEGEECDDGNIEDGDGCSAVCLLEQTEPTEPLPEPECITDDNRICDTGFLGICSIGNQTCVEGFWGQCVQDTTSTDEVCDNQKDDDCDGIIDCDDEDCAEAEVCQPKPECNPGENQSCYTKLSGICSNGTQTCGQDSFWGECVQNTTSTDEVCDNQLDDNCDGLTDCNDLSCSEDPICQLLLPEENNENSTTTE